MPRGQHIPAGGFCIAATWKFVSGKIKIDRRGRKFVKADIGLFEKVEAKSTLIEVKGSKGNSYFVDPEAHTCTCPGFTFRGKCKHTEEVTA